MKKTSFSENQQIKPPLSLNLVHLDIVGPVQESLHGKQIFSNNFLDDYSRFGRVYFLEGKNKKWILSKNSNIWTNEIYNIFNKPIKHITLWQRYKEFKQLVILNSFCRSKGIIHQLTVSHNPQQNGRAERLNGNSYFHPPKALLNDAKLCHQFWEYSVYTANYIHNRLPHSGINNKNTLQDPFQ